MFVESVPLITMVRVLASSELTNVSPENIARNRKWRPSGRNTGRV